jgi:site-specific DNA-cytosine methylase
MRILVACEFSGIVRDAFATRGHDAWSCDLLPSERAGQHFQEDVLRLLTRERFDLLIAHPPCTHLAVSGARWFAGRRDEQAQAERFVLCLAAQPTPMVAIENPIGVLSTRWRKPDQIVHPWQFGHGERKATCLWLKGLPLLRPTAIVEGRVPRIHHEPPSPDRWKNRSRTYQGIADAMAEQWGSISVQPRESRSSGTAPGAVSSAADVSRTGAEAS